MVKFFSKSAKVVLGLYHDAEFYQPEGLATALHPLKCDVDKVYYKDIAVNFKPGIASYCATGVNYYISELNVDLHRLSQKLKRIINAIRFEHPLSFINCNLSGSSFTNCSFGSDVIFEDCILDDTTFSHIHGLLYSTKKVSFKGCKIDKVTFDADNNKKY